MIYIQQKLTIFLKIWKKGIKVILNYGKQFVF